jgi:hypothetical protein
MKPHNKKLKPDADTGEVAFILAEIDNIIASITGRIQRRRQDFRMAVDFDDAIQASSDLETMTSALDELSGYRARVAQEHQQIHCRRVWEACRARGA